MGEESHLDTRKSASKAHGGEYEEKLAVALGAALSVALAASGHC